jgi:hypothetical protein
MKYLSLLFIAVLISCSGSKKTVSSQQVETLKNMVAQKHFQITSDRANPVATSSTIVIANSGLLPAGSNAGMINLIGNNNYLTVKGDTVTAYLPYFGERYSGSNYDTETAIKFDGVPEDYTETYEEGKQRYKINFSIRDKGETYDVTLLLFPNLNSVIDVNTLRRSAISYYGEVTSLKED